MTLTRYELTPVPSPIVLIFGDSDPAKWIEAASYSLATHPDPELARLVDRVVDKVIAAQQPDGYLNTHFTRTQPEMRWKNLREKNFALTSWVVSLSFMVRVMRSMRPAGRAISTGKNPQPKVKWK